MAVGLTSIIVIPAMMNIGVTTAVLPNTGLPLPFISYGGNSILIMSFAVGLVLRVFYENTIQQSESDTRKNPRMVVQ